jgi:hypothetical protein
MKRSILIGVFAVLSAVAVSGLSRASGRHFSNSSLKGTYVVVFRGTTSGSSSTSQGTSLAPENGVGTLVPDGKGSFTGTETANILFNTAGAPTSSPTCPSSFPTCTAVCALTLSGTYTVNSDGSGTTTATATPAGGSDPRCGSTTGFTTTSTIVLQSSKHLVFVGTDPDSTVIGEATRN